MRAYMQVTPLILRMLTAHICAWLPLECCALYSYISQTFVIANDEDAKNALSLPMIDYA